jgi:hypothetical protein
MARTLMFCFFLILIAVNAKATDPALLLYLPLDEGQGGTAADLSVNGNDGELDGPKWVEGKFGKALEFGDRSLVYIPASRSLHGDIFKDNFTLLAWIKPIPGGNEWGHIWRSVDGNDDTQCTLFYNSAGYLSWRGQVGGEWAERCESPAGMIEAEEWSHAAVIGDGANFKIYINGEVAQTSTFEELDGDITDYYLGFDNRQWDEWFTGAIDDVYILKRAMTDDEIKAASEGVLTKIIAVNHSSKIAVTWGHVKSN